MFYITASVTFNDIVTRSQILLLQYKRNMLGYEI